MATDTSSKDGMEGKKDGDVVERQTRGKGKWEWKWKGKGRGRRQAAGISLMREEMPHGSRPKRERERAVEQCCLGTKDKLQRSRLEGEERVEERAGEGRSYELLAGQVH